MGFNWVFFISVAWPTYFGILDFVNLAHGSIYMLGAFICASLYALDSYLFAVILSLPVIDNWIRLKFSWHAHFMRGPSGSCTRNIWCNFSD